nr:site-specific integrase [Methylobacterium sp. L1A1]
MSKKPQAAESRTRRLEAGEWECLRDECARSGNVQLLPMVELGIETAMRRGEVLSIQWKDVDFNKKTLLIPITKNGHARTIPLTPRALQIIEAQQSTKHHSVPRIFPTTEAAIKMAWRRVIRRCCLVDLKYHDLRHEAISRFFELGLSIPEVALISGHRDTKMLMRYTHIRPENVSKKLAEIATEANNQILT